MEELRQWVRKIGLGLSMIITTKSSKPDKIILHCSRSGKYRSGRKKEVKKERDSKKTECPFELHGLLRRGNSYTPSRWTLSVIRGFHNHELPPDLKGVRGAHRLSAEERNHIIVASTAGTKPKSIFTDLINRNPETLLSRTQVYNFKASQRRTSMGELNVTQYSLAWLKEKGYFTDTMSGRRKDGELALSALFISHPDSRHLLRMFPNVVIMDCTYKTNRYVISFMYHVFVIELL
jgi:histone-lysine N-methyltransferase SETD2